MNKRLRFLAVTAAASLLLLSGCDSRNAGSSAPPVSVPVSSQPEVVDIPAAFDELIAGLPAKLLDPDDISINYYFYDKAAYGIGDALYTLPFARPEDYDPAEDEELLNKLAEIQDEDLREDQLLIRDILIDYMERNRRLVSYLELNLSYLGSYIGFLAQLPLLLESYNLGNKNDLDSYFHVLETSPEIFQKYAAWEKERQVNGTGMPPAALKGTIEQCRNFVKEPPFLIQVFEEKIDKADFLTAEEKNAAKEKSKNLLSGAFLDAYRQLEEALSAIDLTGKEDLGLYARKDGTAYYEALLQAATGSDQTVAEVKDYITRKRREILGEYTDLLREVEIPSSGVVTYGDLKNAEETVNYLREQIAADFPKLAELSYQVQQVPDSMKENFSPAAYMLPRFDAPADELQRIYINGDFDQSLFPTLAHEGYPGHMYQYHYFLSTKPPAIRRLMDYNGYSEGWATYVENNAWKYAQGNDNTRQLLHLTSLSQQYANLWLALADIGVHADGWDYAQFKEEMEDFCLSFYGTADFPEDVFQQQYHILLETPTEYLQYFYTGLLFQDMADETALKLGDNFSASDFHRVILETGPAPFSILQKQVDRYVADVLQKTASTTGTVTAPAA